MGKVFFLLDTSADAFADWLLATWHAPGGGIFATDSGTVQLQALRAGQRGGARTLTADAVWVSRVNEQGNQETQDLGDVIKFQLLPLTKERVEIRAECSGAFPLLGYFADVLQAIAARWPELSETLEWYLDSWTVDIESQHVPLAAFDARLRRLKDKAGQRAPIDEPPAFFSRGPQFTVGMQIGTTCLHLVTWLQWQHGNKFLGRLGNFDGSPIDDIEGDKATWMNWDLGPVTLRERIDAGAKLHTVLKTYPPGQLEEAKETAVIGFFVRELTPGPAPVCKLTLRCWPVHPVVFEYLTSVLASILSDYPQARETLVHYILFAEGELPAWMQKECRDFFLVLKNYGSKEGDYLEDHVFRYANEVEKAKRAARDDPPAGADGSETTPAVITGDAGANEPAREDPPARKITGLTLEQEEALKSLWLDNSLTYGDMSKEIFHHIASAEVIRKAGYKLGLPKRKVGPKSGR